MPDAARPDFRWDVDLSVDDWLVRVRHGSDADRAYWLSRALRDARPEDALAHTTWAEIATLWPHLVRHLGRRRALWQWLLAQKGYDVGP